MRSIRCILRYHVGSVQPRHEVDGYDGEKRSVFVCNRCGKVIE